MYVGGELAIVVYLEACRHSLDLSLIQYSNVNEPCGGDKSEENGHEQSQVVVRVLLLVLLITFQNICNFLITVPKPSWIHDHQYSKKSDSNCADL